MTPSLCSDQTFRKTETEGNNKLEDHLETWKTRSSNTLVIGHPANKIDDFMSSYQFSMHCV